ncbi:MAG: hypothetical protein M3Q03_07115 [Chloroflexota bacterium]|nr:hypothetical protein [Chloroflexota bacterium]
MRTAPIVAEPGRDQPLRRCISAFGGNLSGQDERIVVADHGSNGAAGDGGLLLQGDDEIEHCQPEGLAVDFFDREPEPCSAALPRAVRINNTNSPKQASKSVNLAMDISDNPRRSPNSPAIRCSTGS